MPIYHLLLMQDGRWTLVQDGSAPAIKNFRTKREAMTYSLSFIEHCGGSLTIHRLDGSLQEQRTYPDREEAIRAA